VSSASETPYAAASGPLAGCADAPALLDLSTGLNPYGPLEAALEAARMALSERNPDPSAHAARRSVAERFGVDVDQVLIGHGASELAHSCVRAWAARDTVWLAIDPADGDLSASARRAGARVTRWRSVERTGHRVDLQQVGELMRLEQPHVVTLHAPGSPTGAAVPFAQLSQLAEQFPHTRFIVNQSWLSLSDAHADLELPPPPNVICLRSLRLDWALPAVRAGYALLSRDAARALSATRPPFPASPAAAALLQYAVREPNFIGASRERLRADRATLAALLDALGLVYTPSVTHFLLVRIARASEVTEELRREHGIAVCDATSFGLPDHLRISAVAEGSAARLRDALAHVCGRRGLQRGREP